MEKEDKIVIDATDGIMGRISAYAAKQTLLGKTVDIVNCGQVMISGKKNVLINTYKAKLARGGTAQKGPYIERSVEGIFKRAVRGMLPWSKARGREAFKRIKCHEGMPKEFENAKMINFKEDFTKPFITLKELIKYV